MHRMAPRAGLKIKLLVMTTFLVITVLGGWGQTTWTGATNSDWDDASNWSNLVPSAGNEPTIPGALVMWPTTVAATMPTGWTTLTLLPGAQATIPSTINITSIGNAGVLTLAADVTVTGAISNTGTIDLGAVTLSAASLSGAGGIVTSNGGTLNLSAVSTIAVLNNTAGAVTINGGAGLATVLSITGTDLATMNAGAGGMTITDASGGGDLTITGAVTVNGTSGSNIGALTVSSGILTIGGVVTTSAVTNIGTIDVGANSLTADSVSGIGTLTASIGTVNVSGNFTPALFNAGTSTVNLTNTGDVSANTFATLNISGGTRTTTGSLTVTTLTMTSDNRQPHGHDADHDERDVHGQYCRHPHPLRGAGT